ncbi:MAG: hypothetical protein MPJ78_14845 [Hyphomicrobiaceae bacterium]|nr:hypothetical protein [Hyphomicrobiaceae bacterium]
MNPELPSVEVVKRAVLLIWEKRKFALFISSPLIVLYLLSGIGEDTGTFVIFPGGSEEGQSTFLPGLMQAVVFFIGSLVLVFVLFVMAVYWHRSVLLDENTVHGVPLRFDAIIWRYVPYGILTSVLCTAAFVFFGTALSSMLTSFSVHQSAVDVFVFVVLMPLALWLGVASFRLGLVLPAKAIARRSFGLRAAWRLSKGYGWNLLAIISLYFLANIVLVLPLIVAAAIVAFHSNGAVLNPLDLLPKTLSEGVISVLAAVQALLGVGILSVTYAYLTYKTGARSSQD